MMEDIFWEHDALRNSAIRELHSDVYLSPPASRLVAMRLMHELSTVSGEFDPHGLVVFTRMFGVSHFDSASGAFYGVYTSGHPEESELQPNFCLRKVVWEPSFRNVESVLSGFCAKTIFFSYSKLESQWRKTIDAVGHAGFSGINAYEALSQSEEGARANATNVFYAVKDSIVLQGEYRTKKIRNRHLENMLVELGEMFSDLDSLETISARAGSFRISYDFDRVAFLFR